MTKSKKPKQVPTETLAIRTWTPNWEGGPYLARIGNLPMYLKGATEREAIDAALDFRDREMARLATGEENRRKAAERMKARHAAKEETAQ